MASWGLVNTHLDLTFQPPSAATPVPGWANMELVADAVSPFIGQLTVKPLAWTPSTKGMVSSEVVLLLPPGLAAPAGDRWTRRRRPRQQDRTGRRANASGTAAAPQQQPTQAELDAYLISMKDKVRGHIVLVGKHVEVAENFNPAPLRRSEDDWKAAYDPNNANGGRFEEAGAVARLHCRGAIDHAAGEP